MKRTSLLLQAYRSSFLNAVTKKHKQLNGFSSFVGASELLIELPQSMNLPYSHVLAKPIGPKKYSLEVLPENPFVYGHLLESIPVKQYYRVCFDILSIFEEAGEVFRYLSLMMQELEKEEYFGWSSAIERYFLLHSGMLQPLSFRDLDNIIESIKQVPLGTSGLWTMFHNPSKGSNASSNKLAFNNVLSMLKEMHQEPFMKAYKKVITTAELFQK